MGPLENLLGGIYAYDMKKKSIILAVHSMVTVLICSINLFFFTSSAGSEKPSTWCEPAISVWNEENSYVLFRDFAEARLWIGCVPGIFLALTHELARQIEKVMCIVVCSPQLCSFQNCLFFRSNPFSCYNQSTFSSNMAAVVCLNLWQTPAISKSRTWIHRCSKLYI